MLGSCDSPNPVLYTLSVIPGRAQPGGPAVVNIHEISVARYLERPQIVRSAADNRLDVMANEWWGEPWSAMLGRVLEEELSQRLPGSIVFGENGAISSAADATVEINLERMDAAGPQSVALIAQTAVNFANNKDHPVLRKIRIEAPTPTPDTAGLVAAMSAAVGQLADRLADMLRSGRSGG